MLGRLNNVTNVILLIFLLSCSNDSQKMDVIDESNKFQNFTKTITTRAEYREESQDLILAGSVESNPEKIINYIPLFNGIVDQTFFLLGDKVEEGQTLLEIRSPELSALNLEKITLESNLQIAERELQTAKSMFEDGVLSQKDFLAAQGKYVQANTGLQKALTDLSVYGVQNVNGRFYIQSPATGYMIDKKISSGTTLSVGGSPIFTIADLSKVMILVNIYAGDLSFVSEGMTVEISSFSFQGETFKGKIQSIPQVFDTEEKVLKARVFMDNKNLKLKPGMSVTITLKKNKPNKIVSIPSDALIFDNNRYYVVIETDKKKFTNKEVIVSGHNHNISYISNGLNAGEDVVTKNQLLIYSALKAN